MWTEGERKSSLPDKRNPPNTLNFQLNGLVGEGEASTPEGWQMVLVYYRAVYSERLRGARRKLLGNQSDLGGSYRRVLGFHWGTFQTSVQRMTFRVEDLRGRFGVA